MTAQKTPHDLATDEGRLARIAELHREGAVTCHRIGVMMTRDAITRGAMGNMSSLAGFVSGVASTAAMHLAIAGAVAANDPELMMPKQAEALREFGEQLISLANDLALVAQPPATSTTQ